MNNYQPRAPHPRRSVANRSRVGGHATSRNTLRSPGEGIRIEELLELSHHALVQYRLPTSGELVPLLQILPSKTDTERLLVVSPELAEVLAAIIARLRDSTGAVPLVAAYDKRERLWSPPAPLLFQRRIGTEHRAIAMGAVGKLLSAALVHSGLIDPADGQPLQQTPHAPCQEPWTSTPAKAR